jgi:hypothetical protein
VEEPAQPVEHRRQDALGDRTRGGVAEPPFRNSTYQSQKSFQVKSRSSRVASAKEKPSRSAVTAAVVRASRLRIQRSSTGSEARSIRSGS